MEKNDIEQLIKDLRLQLNKNDKSNEQLTNLIDELETLIEKIEEENSKSLPITQILIKLILEFTQNKGGLNDFIYQLLSTFNSSGGTTSIGPQPEK